MRCSSCSWLVHTALLFSSAFSPLRTVRLFLRLFSLLSLARLLPLSLAHSFTHAVHRFLLLSSFLVAPSPPALPLPPSSAPASSSALAHTYPRSSVTMDTDQNQDQDHFDLMGVSLEGTHIPAIGSLSFFFFYFLQALLACSFLLPSPFSFSFCLVKDENQPPSFSF